MSTATLERPPAPGPVTRRRSGRARRPATNLTVTSGIGRGAAMTWFSLLVLIPLCAVVVTASEGGWSNFWTTVTNEQTAAAIRLTVGQAVLVTLVNIVMGTLIAWV